MIRAYDPATPRQGLRLCGLLCGGQERVGAWVVSGDVTVTLTYSEREAREVVRAIRYFDSNVTATYEDHDRMSLIATAIRLRLPPPKPAEPTGLGAVVEDADGVLWVRDAERHDCWFSAPANAVPRRQSWADTDAVRVLSEGVTA